MGSTLSDPQRDLLLARFRGVILFLDGDTAGEQGTAEIGRYLLGHTSMWVRNAPAPMDAHPDQLPADELKRLLS